jgi:hypothetical protein
MIIEQLYKDIYDEELAKGAVLNERMVGFKEDYLSLHCLLRKYTPISFMEIGTHTGWGTLIIKNALGPDSDVFSLDLPDEESYKSLQHPIVKEEEIGWECTLPFTQILEDSLKFDFAQYPCQGYFVDGEHDWEHVFQETREILKQNPKIVVFHDVDEPVVLGAIIVAQTFYGKEYKFYRITDTRIGYLLKKEL